MSASTVTESSFAVRIDSGTGAERLGLLRHALSVTGKVEMGSEEAATFVGEARGKIFGELMIHAVDATPIRMMRDRAWVRSVTRDLIFLNYVQEGRIEGTYNGRPYRVASGCLAISQLSTEMDVMLPEKRISLAIPKAVLATKTVWPDRLDGRVYNATSHVAVLLGRYMEGLLDLSDLSRLDHMRVMTATANLMTDLFGLKHPHPTHCKPHSPRRAAEIKRFILRNLCNVDLNSAMICREFGISPSQLARILGKNFNLAESIRRMRLHNAWRDIVEGRAPRSMKSLGEKWGIGDEGTFRRNFRREFGMPPSEAARQGNLDTERIADITRSMAELEHWFKEG